MRNNPSIYYLIWIALYSDSIELLPCPFCGEPASESIDESGDYQIYVSIACSSCGAHCGSVGFSFRTKKISYPAAFIEASREWNRRHNGNI